MGQLDEARHLLGRLKHLPIEKYWKVMMEGALLEARAGRYRTVGREILKYLTHYGEAFTWLLLFRLLLY